MAEYYPLLAKAVGSLPNSTPDTRRVVYERARKALIGQLRTLHPPVPDEDIERESVELDRAVERLEAEIANGAAPAAPSPPPAKTSPPAADAKSKKPPPSKPPPPPPVAPLDGSTGPEPSRTAPRPPALPERKPMPPRPPLPKPVVPRPARPAAAEKVLPPPAEAEAKPTSQPGNPSSSDEASAVAQDTHPPALVEARAEDSAVIQPRQEEPRSLKPPQRPIAPQPPGPPTTRRRLWIIPAVVALVVAIIAVAAWKLRDRPDTLARKPAEKTQSDSGKIAERVGGPAPSASNEESTTDTKPAAGEQAGTTPPPRPSANPEVPVARRAALLVEAPDEPNKVKTFVGNVVWKLNNAPQGANATVGLAVEADVDLPDDKLKAVITFEKNSDASLPASHTIKIRFVPEGGSFTGGVKQISVPQMRPEASPNGEPLAGVTVQIVPNSFLVGLSPGNAEAANTDLMRRLQWVDVPMLLDNGKIAKLTFEKGDSGQRDLNEAFEAWQK